jgi:hypothetical protein
LAFGQRPKHVQTEVGQHEVGLEVLVQVPSAAAQAAQPEGAALEVALQQRAEQSLACVAGSQHVFRATLLAAAVKVRQPGAWGSLAAVAVRGVAVDGIVSPHVQKVEQGVAVAGREGGQSLHGAAQPPIERRAALLEKLRRQGNAQALPFVRRRKRQVL